MNKTESGNTVIVSSTDEYIVEYLVEFAKRIKERDVVVLGESQDSIGKFFRVEFQKRNGRGKAFRETIWKANLVLERRPNETHSQN